MFLNKTPNTTNTKLRGGNYKTPVLGGNTSQKGGRSRNTTPSRNMDFRGATEGDRYVPQHSMEQFSYARVMFHDESKENRLNTSSSLPNSPEKDRIKSNLMRGKSANDLLDNGMDMFRYRRDGAPIVAGTKKQNVLYKCMNPSSSVRKAKRVYSKSPHQCVDAPGLLADYYYNILDWSSKHLVAVAILDKVYTFDAATSASSLFKDFNNNAITITSVKFSKDGAYLAVGADNGFIHLFRVDTKQQVRKFGTGNWRICSAAWTSCGLLSFGNRGGLIQTHDTRQRLSFLSETRHHEAEVCGLNWICNDQYLVSGSADSIVNVYSKDTVIRQEPTVLYALDDHTSTVKAITECPFMYGNIIATSGGLNDGTVKFWNLSTGELVTNVETGNQTSAIVFDQYYREMATCHGGNKHCINVWKYSAATSDFSLAHEIDCTSRPLNMVKSVCDEFIAVTNDSEELSFFDLFKKDEKYHQDSIHSRMKLLSLKFDGVRQQIR